MSNEEAEAMVTGRSREAVKFSSVKVSRTWRLTGICCLFFPGGTVAKNLPANAGDVRDTGWIPGS